MAPEVAMASGEMPYSGTPGSSKIPDSEIEQIPRGDSKGQLARELI